MRTNTTIERFVQHLHRSHLSLQYILYARSNPETVQATISIATDDGRAVGVDDETLGNFSFPVMITYEGKDLQAGSIANMTLHLMEWLKSENYTVVMAKQGLVPLWPRSVPRRRAKSASGKTKAKA
jgi:hypothetical protein